MENEKIGPGAYDANYFIAKPKPKGFVIKPPETKGANNVSKSEKYLKD